MMDWVSQGEKKIWNVTFVKSKDGNLVEIPSVEGPKVEMPLWKKRKLKESKVKLLNSSGPSVAERGQGVVKRRWKLSVFTIQTPLKLKKKNLSLHMSYPF